MSIKKIISMILSLLMIMGMGINQGFKVKASTISNTTRLAGDDRIGTSVEIAKAEYKDTKPGAVVISTGFEFADALSGSVMAYKLKAPILLVSKTVTDSQESLDYITTNLDKSKPVYALGGQGAVSDAVVNYLKARGYTVTRLAGIDRYDTNQKIVDDLKVSGNTPVVIASGEGFADALSISNVAASKGYPVLLSEKDNLSANALNDIKLIQPSTIYIVGGVGVLSGNIEKQIKGIKNDANIVRIAGIDRYETSMNIVKYFNITSDTMTLASGVNFPDALSGSVLAAKDNCNLLLINGKDINTQKSMFTNINNVILLGGQGAITDFLFTPDPYAGIGDNPDIIMEWSKKSHLKGDYDSASQGYAFVTASSLASLSLKMKAKAYLELSKNHFMLQPVQTTAYSEDSKAKRDEFKAAGYSYMDKVYYSTTGDYFEASQNKNFREQPGLMHIDADGVPMVMYAAKDGGDGQYHYNPVTVAQYCLYRYGSYINGSSTLNQFLLGIRRLVKLQGADGALRYYFTFNHYLDDNPLKPGWVSSMAQGQAISAFVRAYQLTGDKTYLNCADNAYKFMCIPVTSGGTKDTLDKLDGTSNVFFQEYVTTPKSYTLNGYVFSMIGIYDLSQTPDSTLANDAADMFAACSNSLLRVLYKYDMGHFTSYDAGYITKPGQYPDMNVGYHNIHIEITGAMYYLTKNPVYKYYNLMWKSYTKE